MKILNLRARNLRFLKYQECFGGGILFIFFELGVQSALGIMPYYVTSNR